MKKKYVITENPYDGKNCITNFKKNVGYHFIPKNKVRYHDAIKVDSLFVMKPSFIDKLLKKKSQKKLDYYLQYLISILDDNDTDSGKLSIALNDLARFRDIIEYKYRKYLDDKYIDLLLKKISLLEHELKTKIVYQQWKTVNPYNIYTPVEEETKGKGR